jgi:hypothetical protein
MKIAVSMLVEMTKEQPLTDALNIVRYKLASQHGYMGDAVASVELTGGAIAQGTEAQRAATVEQGAVHDGPVAESDAPKGGSA